MSTTYTTEALPRGVSVTSALLCLMLAISLLWAGLAPVDVVISARGQLVPTRQVHTVQAAEPGVVQTRWVKEGDRVHAGQTLLTLSPAMLTQDIHALRHELHQARLNWARVQAELAGHDQVQAPESTPPSLLADAQARLLAHRTAHQAALADARVQIEQARAGINVAEAQADRLARSEEVMAHQATVYRQLLQDGHVSGLMAQDKQHAWQDLHAQWLTQKQVITRERQLLLQGQSRLAQIVAQYNKALQDEHAQWTERTVQLTDALEKAEQKQALLTIISPIEGTVQGGPLPSTGTVISVGMPLMQVVPEHAPLEAEIWLSNADRPHVASGQTVTLKLEAWPFTKHGTLTGTLRHLDPTAHGGPNESMSSRAWSSPSPPGIGLVPEQTHPYRAYVSLQWPGVDTTQTGKIGQKQLQPGLLAQADILVGERTVLSYLLSPILQTLQESGREPS